ncbi:MAG: hypothetical protein ACLR17_01240 [Enterobacteriaceae bacterium]
MRVAANQLRTEMIPQIGRNGQLADQASVASPNPDDPVIGGDFKGDEVASRTDENFSGNDLPFSFLAFCAVSG